MKDKKAKQNLINFLAENEFEREQTKQNDDTYKIEYFSWLPFSEVERFVDLVGELDGDTLEYPLESEIQKDSIWVNVTYLLERFDIDGDPIVGQKY